MRGKTLEHAELLEVIQIANREVGQPATADGTFVVHIAIDGLLYLERVTETRGYEVAYLDVQVPGTYLEPGQRFGMWTDPETGKVCLDFTMHLLAPERLALELAHEWEQKAIWSWERQECLNVAEMLDLV